MAFKDWSETAADNDDADATINWLEGQAPSTVNGSARAMMAALKKSFGHFVNVKDMGAACDGVTDDTAVFQSAATYCSANGFILTAPAGSRVRLTGNVSVSGGLRMHGDFEILQAEDHLELTIEPTPASPVTVTASNTVTYPAVTGITQTTALTVSDGTQFTRGDVCVLRSEDTYSGASYNTIRKAELVEVNEVVGNTVNLCGKISDTYSTNPELVKLNDAIVDIDGPSFTYDGDAFSYAGVQPTRFSALRIIGAVRPRVRARFHDDLSAGCHLFTCWKSDVEVEATNLRDALSLSIFGYGAIASAACYGGIIRVVADRVRHAYTNGVWATASDRIRDGVCRRMTVTGNATNCSSAAWDTHPGAHETCFVDCSTIFNVTDTDQNDRAQSFAFQDRGVNTRIVNPRSKNARTFIAATVTVTDNGTVTNNMEIVGGVVEQDLDITSLLSVGSFQAQTSPDTVKVRFDGTVFRGYAHNQNAQSVEVVEFYNVRFHGFNVGWSWNNNTTAGGVRYVKTEFHNFSTIRVGQGNLANFLGCRRYNLGVSNVEPLLADINSTVYIDDYYAEATTYGLSNLIRGSGSGAGTVTFYVGKLSAKNFASANAIGDNGTVTVVVNDLTHFRPLVTADVGNAAKTLTAKVDPPTQIWATTLTADRTVTLSTTGAFNGAEFHIVRPAGGAFNLNVGTGPLKALAASQWCDVVYNGSAWTLKRFGSL